MLVSVAFKLGVFGFGVLDRWLRGESSEDVSMYSRFRDRGAQRLGPLGDMSRWSGIWLTRDLNPLKPYSKAAKI